MFKLVQAEETESMASAVRTVMHALSPMSRVAAIADGPDAYDAPLWSALSDRLGVTGVLVPEEHGGLGLGWREAGIILAELGRGLACVPFLESAVVAPAVIMAAEDADAATDLLPRISDGSMIVTVGLGDAELFAHDASSPLRAHEDTGSWSVSGHQPFVVHAESADIILLLCSTDEGDHSWFTVDPNDESVTLQPMSVIDATRPQFVVVLENTPARPVGSFGARRQLLSPALTAAVVGAACEQEAASQFLLETTVQYVRNRYQFGRPIGSFQALQHRLADLAVMVDQSTSAVEYALWALADAPERAVEAASIAGFTCAETMFSAASETIQMHGGIGFTWEHLAHRYYRRALTSRVQFGKPTFHRERLLESLSI